ncbi:hypothetical protein [Pseudomonas fluorescens]|uniref:Uncharacterized protein n=1 Tax=Pseudomonas fluorescens TaxID=294 RepID=A0A5E7N1E2_PSEFL|nr:hypothetical protein [Pseudomonas fluorescens]VVP30821.1 hypothetical protein PS880_04329 [Pseudomonas fluorescens]
MNTPFAEQSPQQTIRPGFFDEAFRDAELPQPLRTFAEAFCTRFEVRGICDPMYCANVTAFETGLGDGSGNFNAVKTPTEADIAKVADRLLFAYSTCITKASSGTTPETIATMLRKALNGSSLEELIPDHVPDQQPH